MSEGSTIKFDATCGDKVRCTCRSCDNDTRHEVIKSVDVHWFVANYQIQGDEKFQIVQCLGCETFSFRRFSMNSEDFDPEGGYIESIEMYPPRLAGRRLLAKLHHLPHKVEYIYKEAHSALIGGLPILTAIGIRALIEAVCEDQEIERGTLEGKIDELVNQGLLASSGSEVLHKLRLLGNQSAHKLKRHSSSKLNLAFDVIENLLLNIYILPNESEAL